MTITKLDDLIIIDSKPILPEIFERDMVEYRLRNKEEDMADAAISPTFMFADLSKRFDAINSEWYFVSVDSDEVVDQTQEMFGLICTGLKELSERRLAKRSLN